MSFLQRITQTGNTHLALALVRVWAGSMMVYHGYMKLGTEQSTTDFITYVMTKLQMHDSFAWTAMLSEFVGGLLLIFGCFTRVASLFIAATMSVAVFGTHLHDPWSKKELALVYLVLSIAFLITGGGMYSVDAKLSRRQ